MLCRHTVSFFNYFFEVRISFKFLLHLFWVTSPLFSWLSPFVLRIFTHRPKMSRPIQAYVTFSCQPHCKKHCYILPVQWSFTVFIYFLYCACFFSLLWWSFENLSIFEGYSCCLLFLNCTVPNMFSLCPFLQILFLFSLSPPRMQ